jgi:uncharacterized protein YhfF
MSAGDAIVRFWEASKADRAKRGLHPFGFPEGGSPLAPPAWSFGATPEHADELLALVLDGTKTATASALWDYEAEREPLPEVGQLDIVLDAAGRPRALLRTSAVEVVPFAQVSADHAYREGEGDRSLAYWREVHRDFFTEFATHEHGFSEQMPVVLQSFEVIFTGA